VVLTYGLDGGTEAERRGNGTLALALRKLPG
jgi:hypothetical protein